jgi:hypothetical protein
MDERHLVVALRSTGVYVRQRVTRCNLSRHKKGEEGITRSWQMLLTADI